MKKPVFKSNLQDQVSLFPARLDQNIPEEAPVRLVNQIVDKLDISAIEKTYKGGGASSYHPRMMLKVLFYAYMNNIYSCRKIEKHLVENIHYMWLSGKQTPDFRTINNFRSKHLKGTINQVFTQVVLMLVEMGYISLQTVYIDGTKMESRAGRYTFVWRKTIEKNKARLETKIREILKMIDEGIAQDDLPNDEPPTPIDSDELKKRIDQINRENLSKQEQKAVKTLEEKHLPKLLVSCHACSDIPSIVLLISDCVKKSFTERCYAQIFCLVKNQNNFNLNVISDMTRHLNTRGILRFWAIGTVIQKPTGRPLLCD